MNDPLFSDSSRWFEYEASDDVYIQNTSRDAFMYVFEDEAPLALEAIQTAHPETFEEYVRENTHFTEPENPDPSPGDVAETWIRMTDPKGGVVYTPNGSLEMAEYHGHYGDAAVTGYSLLYKEATDVWAVGDECSRYVFDTAETVDAADVPFSEVPADE